MRKNLSRLPPEAALDRVLAGLGAELIEATDEEIAQAAEDLGMNLKMKGSAAFMGVTFSMPKRIEDIFDVEELRAAYAEFMRGRRLPSRKDGSEDDER